MDLRELDKQPEAKSTFRLSGRGPGVLVTGDEVDSSWEEDVACQGEKGKACLSLGGLGANKAFSPPGVPAGGAIGSGIGFAR